MMLSLRTACVLSLASAGIMGTMAAMPPPLSTFVPMFMITALLARPICAVFSAVSMRLRAPPRSAPGPRLRRTVAGSIRSLPGAVMVLLRVVVSVIVLVSSHHR